MDTIRYDMKYYSNTSWKQRKIRFTHGLQLEFFVNTFAFDLTWTTDQTICTNITNIRTTWIYSAWNRSTPSFVFSASFVVSATMDFTAFSSNTKVSTISCSIADCGLLPIWKYDSETSKFSKDYLNLPMPLWVGTNGGLWQLEMAMTGSYIHCPLEQAPKTAPDEQISPTEGQRTSSLHSLGTQTP